MDRLLSLKQQCVLSTALVSAAFFSYGRRAYAACANSGGSSYLCSGANAATLTINANDADVSTASGFSVNAAAGNAIYITGDGDLRFTDANSSTISAGAASQSGLRIFTTDDNGGTLGSVAVNTSAGGSIYGKYRGISTTNYGTGSMSITVNGDATGNVGEGVYAHNYTFGSALTINIGSTSTVQGGSNGVLGRNYGSGALTIVADGDITATSQMGIRALSYGTNIIVTTGASSSVQAATWGIQALNSGSGSTAITIDGSVVVSSGTGVMAKNYAAATSLTVTTGAASTVQATSTAIYGRNLGAGAVNIQANGDVTSSGGSAIYARNDGTGTSLTITTGAGTIQAGTRAINVRQHGSGAFTITTGAGTVQGDGRGIDARSYGAGAFTITVNGDVTGTSQQAIYARSAGGVSIDVNGGATLSGTRAILTETNTVATIEFDGSSSTVTAIGTGGTAIDLSGQNDSLTLKGTVNITGNIEGNGGTDTLVFNNATTTLTTSTISGFEAITVIGDSTVTGDIDATGIAITSSGNGSLHVNGNFTATSFTVGSNSVFAGNNTFTGDLIIDNTGTLAPGNSIGTINVVGDLTFANGSIFDVEVDGATADQVNVTGNINIDSGATLNIIPLSTFSGSADILTATGTITGTFGTINYGGQTVGILYTTTTVSLDTALALLSYNPSALNAQLQSSLNSGLMFSDTLADVAADNAFRKEKNYWIRSLYRHNSQATIDSYSGYNNNVYGVAMGGEYPVSENYKIGFSFANLLNNSNAWGGVGDNDNSGSFASMYGTFVQPLGDADMFATIGLIAGYHDNNNKRLVNNSNVYSYAKSDSQDTDIGGLLQLGLRKNLSSAWTVIPRLSILYMNTDFSGFSEEGGGAAGVVIDDYNSGTAKIAETIGIANNAGFSLWRGVIVRPRAEIGLSQEIAVTDRMISGTFSNSTRFTTTLNDRDKHSVNGRLGADVIISDDVTALIDYKKSYSTHEDINDVRANLNVAF